MDAETKSESTSFVAVLRYCSWQLPSP